MFNTTDSSNSIPAFIAKLWEMVNDKKYDYLIQWCPDGTSFVIKDQSKFCSEILPIFYKHNNMASFIRQLNKYGFRKVVPIDSASLKNDRNDLEFAHGNFVRDFPTLLNEIRRKITNNNKNISINNVVAQLAQHVQQIQQKHNILESKFVSMKNENNALWREHSLLRHKHQKLQKIVNKLIQFLVTLVQQTRGLNIKRRPVPLMIKDSTKFPIQSYGTIKNQTNPISLINDINQMETSPEVNTPELIVPELLDESVAKSILSDIAEYNSISDSKLGQLDTFPERSSLVAVPIQEVSPALVYGKYSNKINELSEDKNKSKQPSALISNNSKTKRLKRKKQRSTVTEESQNEPENISVESVQPTASTGLSSLKAIKGTSTKSTIPSEPIPLIQIVSPAFTASPQVGIQDAPMDMPEIVVLNPESIDDPNFLKDQPQFIVRNDSVGDQNIKIYDLKNDGEPITEVTSMPIILSPSGAEMSPAHTSEEKNDNPLAISDQNISPLQKDIDTMQSDLDALKEMLQSENFSIDATALLGLFSADDPLSLNMPEAGIASGSGALPSGNELISYNPPNLVDIIDCFDDSEPSEYTEPLSVASQTLNTPKPDPSINYDGPQIKRRKKL